MARPLDGDEEDVSVPQRDKNLSELAPELHDKISAVAAANGRSISEEIEWRLERSLRQTELERLLIRCAGPRP